MILFVIIAVCTSAVFCNNSGVKNLIGEPDYRQVRLHWEADQKSNIDHFQVRYCELQTWGTQRCRTNVVTEPDTNSIDHEENIKMYTTEIKGLRMATTYSFEIRTAKEPGEREDRADGDDKNQNIIVIPTKGFSAKATQCLPLASEIEVSTGPYFGGRIAVEATDGERCAVDGDPTSPRDSYTLRINHTECGSQVNDTTVATFVIVQENLPILTHSTRRFLVLCSYQPETLTVRAGLNLPTNHVKGQGHMTPITFDDNNQLGRNGRNIRTGRAFQKPLALVQDEKVIIQKNTSSTSNIVPIFVISMLTVAFVIGVIVIALKITTNRRLQNMDNVSVISDLSSSSYTTMHDVEEISDEQNNSRRQSDNKVISISC